MIWCLCCFLLSDPALSSSLFHISLTYSILSLCSFSALFVVLFRHHRLCHRHLCQHHWPPAVTTVTPMSSLLPLSPLPPLPLSPPHHCHLVIVSAVITVTILAGKNIVLFGHDERIEPFSIDLNCDAQSWRRFCSVDFLKLCMTQKPLWCFTESFFFHSFSFTSSFSRQVQFLQYVHLRGKVHGLCLTSFFPLLSQSSLRLFALFLCICLFHLALSPFLSLSRFLSLCLSFSFFPVPLHSCLLENRSRSWKFEKDIEGWIYRTTRFTSTETSTGFANIDFKVALNYLKIVDHYRVALTPDPRHHHTNTRTPTRQHANTPTRQHWSRHQLINH